MLAIAVVGSTPPAHAGLIIDPGIALTNTPNQYFDSSITNLGGAATVAVENTIITAIQDYQSLFTNNMNVQIYFSVNSNASGGSSNASTTTFTYQQFYNQLVAQSAAPGNAAQRTALGTGGSLPNQVANPIPNLPVGAGNNLTLTTADSRALGGAGAANGALNVPQANNGKGGIYDGSITLGVGNPTDANPALPPTLLSTTQHEIDEVLGLGSGLDNFKGSTVPWVEDLYRFTTGTPGSRSYSNSNTVNSSFSINNGTTDIVSFNQQGPPLPSGVATDYGDWVKNSPQQVQDFVSGSTLTIKTDAGYEITALNVIGYSLVPEPSTGTLAIIAVSFGLVMAANRKRGQQQRRQCPLAKLDANL